MKLNKLRENKVMQVYNAYWDGYLRGDIPAMASLLAEEYTQVGSAESEVFFNKKEAVQFLYDTIDQVAGKLEMRNRNIKLDYQDNIILIHELCDLYALTDEEWIFYSKFRASTLMQEKEQKWKIIHQHSSFPDTRTGEGENIAIEKMAEENRQLRDAVKRRTIELEQKNKELLLESSLERVRAIAMGMRSPADLLDICEILFAELHNMDFSELRNTMINIHDDDKGSFLNYDFSEDAGKTITHHFYNSHPVIANQVKQVRSSKDAFSETIFAGKDLEDWKAFRKQKGERDDPKVDAIPALFYYFYSIGNGSIGISTYSSITEEKRNILRRFRNVFDFAYQRYLDVTQAEAQAREAQIELALERVRARTMAMQHSEELQEAANLLFQQVQTLGIPVWTCGYNIWEPGEKFCTGWMSTNGSIQPSFRIPLTESPTFIHINESRLKGEPFFVEEVSGEALAAHYRYMFSLPDFKEIASEQLKDGFVLPLSQIHNVFNFKHGNLIFISGIPVPESWNVFKRFANVFEQTYTRFLDLQKAEAQAREAQIELGLERVRARAMAMQKSDELSELVDTVFKELTRLDFALTWCIINIIDESSMSNTVWAANPDINKAPESYHMLFEDYPFHHAMMKGWKERKTKHVYVLEGNEKKEYDDYLFSKTEFRRTPAAAQLASRAMEKYVVSFSFSNFGGLQTVGAVPLSDANIDILSRFGKVFDLTYTRFNDLQKAEAQAREAKIEAALERARTQSMIMQHSKELDDTLRVFHEQVQLLGINSAFSFLWLPDEEKDRHIFWAAWTENVSPTLVVDHNSTVFKSKAINYPLDRNEPATAQCLSDWKSNETIVSYHVPPSGVENYFAAWQELIDGVEQLKPEYFAGGLFYVEAFMKYGCFGVMVTTDLKEDEKKILGRFAIEFERAYTRFLDLQKAEAQARESQIQLAMERVRARTMAMQQSDELPEAANLLFQQVQTLGMPAWSAGYCTWDDETRKVVTLWMSSEGVLQPPFKAPTTEDELFIQMRKGYEEGKTLHIVEMGGKKLEKHYQYMRKLPVVGEILDSIIATGHPLPTYQIMHQAYFSKGFLLFITYEPVPEAHDIFKRFANVFDQTYTRFLDLQKAEAQAREADIELSLERVRSKAMAMHSSSDILSTTTTAFEELKKLGIHSIRCGIGLLSKNSMEAQVYASTTDSNGVFQTLVGARNMNEHPSLFRQYQSWLKQENLVEAMSDEELKSYYNKLFFQSSATSTITQNFNNKQYGYYFSFADGLFYSWSDRKYTENEINILNRFNTIVALTFRRFLDLQKAEAQAREAQIEAALERVRSRSIGMQKSEELKEVIKVVFDQFVHLNINLDHAGFVVDYQPKADWHFWIADKQEIPSKITHPYFNSAWANQFDEAKEKGIDFFATNLNFEEKNKFYRELFSFIPGLSEESKQFYFDSPGLTASNVLLENVALYIENFSAIPYTEEENAVLMRFGKVFQQTYTRFLDLQKAEAQARESQIQLALERVRARTAAMHKSDELTDVAELLFKQVNDLGINAWTTGFNVWSDDDNAYTDYITNPKGGFMPPYTIDATIMPVSVKLSNAKKSGVEFYVNYEEGEALVETYRGLIKFGEKQFTSVIESGFEFPTHQYEHFVFGSKVSLMFITYEPVPEAHEIFKRFAKVFEQTYTRFLDLQKAEAQAREAQIEAALERVRSRTMAMQHSSELADAATLLFKQMQPLDIPAWSTGYCIWEDDKQAANFWMSSEGVLQSPFKLPLTEEPVCIRYREAYLQGEEFYAAEYSGETLSNMYAYIMSFPAVSNMWNKFMDEGIAPTFPTFQVNHVVYFAQGFLLFVTHQHIPEAHDIFKRFGKVFEQTYTRFLDLQKAEAQAREAQIEAALERVRSRTMAMQRSDELQDSALLLFQQIAALGVPSFACGFNIWDDDKKAATAWMARKDALQPPFKTSSSEDVFLQIYDAAQRGESLFVAEQEGKTLEVHYEYMTSIPVFRDVMEKMAEAGLSVPTFQIIHCAFFLQGYLMFISYEPVHEAYDIFRRFAKVFEQTYTRFLDLQKAEAQALETIKRASVDRVRAEIASMRTTDDLERIQPLIWNELKTLGVPFIRCGVFIMDEEQQQVNTLLSTPDGKAIAAFRQPYNTPGETAQIIANWHKKEMYKQHWGEAEFIEFTTNLIQQGAITSGEKYLTENRPTNLYLHFLPFLQGMLYAGNTTPLSEDELQLVQNLADAFSTAYARYEDFNKLESAKEQVEKTLVDLKQAQTQLVQSEKMASLGELTAGIAHEIQNPLNFVNNFSEVSNELIDEMVEEVNKGNYEEVKQIADDVKQNLDKINHHGKRAEAIVKGMLQHSRTSSAVKEPTHINKLADEYLRLAYHGLRAKDKSFNATILTDYDQSIDTINIIPQDIGRVMLNLINNAFYAVSEKKKQAGDNYEPTISMKTSLNPPSGGRGAEVFISVKDNGSGIPQKIIGKIFQPFFTTKPTGQGTGLGLSLSYDIIKAQGGEIKVETKEGKGSEFIIQLPIN